MKRLLISILVLFALSVFAGDTYKIFLKDGKMVTTDTKPDIKGDRVYFERFGMLLYIFVDKVDIQKMEKGGNLLAPEENPGEVKKASKRLVVTEEELNEVRQRSRLANEDELRTLDYAVPEEGGASNPRPGGVAGQAASGLQRDMESLMSQKSQVQSQLNDLMNELNSKKDQYGFATQLADKDRLDGEIRDTESRLNDTRSRLSSLENEIMAKQQEIALTPIVVESEEPASAPPPPPSPPPAEE